MKKKGSGMARTGILSILVLILITGCTARGAFEGSTQNRKNECEKYVSNREYMACMDRANMTYDEYEKLQEENQDDPD